MSTLYEITGRFLMLEEMAKEKDIEQDVIKDTLESLEFELEEKAEYCAKIIRSLECDADSIDNEIRRLEQKKKCYKNNAEKIKKNLETAMITANKTKFKTVLFGFNIQKNPPSVVIDDENAIPEQYVKQEPKIDKSGIKDFLNKSGDTSWAHLVQTESLRIR